jgi:glyoxylase-like metal-dependent hydrolase (beta-lactamase superfamily II)
MKIIPISEGTFTIDSTKLFVPFDEEKDILQSRPTGSLLVEIQPFVVVTPRDILLLDTGLGFEKDGEMQLHSNLRAAGFEPSDITKVLLSHLHKDHAGGVGRELKTGKELALPNARYYLQESELNFAFEKGFPSFLTEELECLKNAERVTLLKGNGFIDEYIQYEVTHAHSPHHQVFWIRAENETIFFGADDAPQLQQMKHKFVAKYDYDGKKAMELRRNWKEQGTREGWTFLFYHDVTNAVWKFSNTN